MRGGTAAPDHGEPPMRVTILSLVAAAATFGLAAPATAAPCLDRPPVRPICVLPSYCVMYEDGTIVCYW
jgi:hypothetical protein